MPPPFQSGVTWCHMFHLLILRSCSVIFSFVCCSVCIKLAPVVTDVSIKSIQKCTCLLYTVFVPICQISHGSHHGFDKNKVSFCTNVFQHGLPVNQIDPQRSAHNLCWLWAVFRCLVQTRHLLITIDSNTECEQSGQVNSVFDC